MTDAELGEQTVNAAVGATLRATAEEPMDVRTDVLHFAELRDACRACEQAMRDLLMAAWKGDNLWANLSAAQSRAREILDKVDGP